jgi:hypothetical protein
MNLERKYKKSLDEQWCLRLKTDHPDGDTFDGVITQISKDFVVICQEEAFEFDGIVILPKKFITGCRDNKFERCGNEILRMNGALKKCRMPQWLNGCESLPDILAALKERDIWPGIEAIFGKKPTNAFYLGPVTGIAADRFSIKCYDAAGNWEKDYWLKYKRIFKIEIDSQYCRHFNKYMRAKDKTEKQKD